MYIRIKSSSYEKPRNLTIGKLYKVTDGYYEKDDGFVAIYMGDHYCAHIGGYWEVVPETNRQRLRIFLDKNKANKQRLSLALGKSKSWLSTMCYESKREDIADDTLNNIMSMLTIDWQSTSPLQVTTAGYVPYTTIPANYSRPQDKQRLLDAFFNGDVK